MLFRGLKSVANTEFRFSRFYIQSVPIRHLNFVIWYVGRNNTKKYVPQFGDTTLRDQLGFNLPGRTP